MYIAGKVVGGQDPADGIAMVIGEGVCIDELFGVRRGGIRIRLGSGSLAILLGRGRVWLWC